MTSVFQDSDKSFIFNGIYSYFLAIHFDLIDIIPGKPNHCKLSLALNSLHFNCYSYIVFNVTVHLNVVYQDKMNNVLVALFFLQIFSLN